jgi:DNA-binding transcriptional ArsR family regulator
MYKKSLPISVEQAKLLGHTLRVKIIGVLAEKAKTAKQVATQLGESPGNVHYHMQKLYQGELIELVEERPVGGVIEKYYRARATSFDSQAAVYPELGANFNAASATSMGAALSLKEEDKEDLLREFRELMERWVVKTSTPAYAAAEEFVMGMQLVSRKEKDNENI